MDVILSLLTGGATGLLGTIVSGVYLATAAVLWWFGSRQVEKALKS